MSKDKATSPMQNIFDTIQKTAFNVVAKTFGCSASWNPSDGSQSQSCILLYKDATEKTGLSDVDFTIERYTAEYQYGDFTALSDSVSKGNTEKISIETTSGIYREFFIRRVETKYDGKTLIATLNPI